MTANNLAIGGKYNWVNQPDRLIYLGKKGAWHQFKKIGDAREVWCEVLDEDLPSIEKTKQDATATPASPEVSATKPALPDADLDAQQLRTVTPVNKVGEPS